jgi:hypothetical protein
MEALADRLDDDRLRADAAKRRSSYSMRIADRARRSMPRARARDWAERAGDIDLQLRAQNLMASGLNDLGEVAEARPWRSRAWRRRACTACAGSKAAFSTPWR